MSAKNILTRALLKILASPSTNFYFGEIEYVESTLCMWLMGMDILRFFVTKQQLFRISFFSHILTRKKQSFSSNESNLVSSTSSSSIKNLEISNISHVKESAMDYIQEFREEKASSKSKKIRPNYFVAFQITDEEVHSSVKCVQEHILEQDKRLEKTLISRNTLHITLIVLHLKDSQDHSNAMKALHAVHQEYNTIMCEEPLQLEFTGIGNFGNKVVFAKIKENASYQRLCNITKSIHVHLEAVGLKSTDTRKTFNPHLTIAKLDFTKKPLKGIKKIPSSLYNKYIELPFGCNTIKSIQLLKMNGPKTASGYYAGDELFFRLSRNASFFMNKK